MLRIEITKRQDGTGVLRCIREDGSRTWQKQEKHAAFFALHDLTHYAVETALRCRCGFFGLIAAGWEIDETTGKSARGQLSPEALEVERIVGLFNSERSSGVLWTADEFNQFSPRQLSQVELHRIRRLRSELFERWRTIGPGGNLELEFEPTEVESRNE